MSYTETTEIRVMIRLLPSGDDVEIELPLYSTGGEIVEALLEDSELNLPKNDPEGNPYVYKLFSKARNVEISPEKSLFDVGVREDEILLLMPKLVAGTTHIVH